MGRLALYAGQWPREVVKVDVACTHTTYAIIMLVGNYVPAYVQKKTAMIHFAWICCITVLA